MSQAKISRIPWDKIVNQVARCNPDIARIITNMPKNTQYPLYIADYPFGTKIVENGILNIPDNEGNLHPLNTLAKNNPLRIELEYNDGHHPLLLILNNAVEQYIEYQNQLITTLGFIEPGKIINATSILQANNDYSITQYSNIISGGRSLFILPKVSDCASLKKVERRFNIRLNKPKSLNDHWEFIHNIIQSSPTMNKWHCKIVIFPKSWFKNNNQTTCLVLSQLFQRLLNLKQRNFYRKFLIDLLFTSIQTQTPLRFCAYTLSQVKNLYYIASGAMPGYAPATTNIAGPLSDIQETLVNIYGIKNYSPTIMQPCYLTRHDNKAVYYSLEVNSGYDNAYKNTSFTSKICAMDRIQSLHQRIEQILSRFTEDDIPRNLLELIYTSCHFNFYHSNNLHYKDILLSDNIAKDDLRFTTNIKPNIHGEFANKSPFMNGCIRISRFFNDA